jgi:uncharacterized protein
MSNPVLYIKEVKGKGRAVFSTTPIQENDLIEECPLIALAAVDFDIVTSTEIVNYCFFLDKEERILALAMGFGSLYNHAFPCNAHHIIDKETKTITIFALRDIKANEEICINYNGDPANDSVDWFVSRNIDYRP